MERFVELYTPHGKLIDSALCEDKIEPDDIACQLASDHHHAKPYAFGRYACFKVDHLKYVYRPVERAELVKMLRPIIDDLGRNTGITVDLPAEIGACWVSS